MKRICLIIGFVFIMLFPLSVFASELDLSRYTKETLEEALTAEQISITQDEIDKYNEGNSSDKVKIYVFRKDGCGNCKNFLNYTKTLIAKYGGKFEIISFELSNNPINFTALNQISEFYNNKPADGVYKTPYISIGNKSFSGDIDSTKQQQIESIIASNTKFDVVEKINSGITNINDTVKNEFVDLSNGIKFFSNNSLDSSYNLKVTEGTHKNLPLEGYNFIATYDISMYDSSNTIVPLNNGSFKITIPVSEKYNSYKVAYINNNQISDVLESTYENGNVVFSTSHLSEYAIYGTNENKANTIVNEKNPKTLDKIQIYEIMLLIGSIVLLIGINSYKKQRNL